MKPLFLVSLIAVLTTGCATSLDGPRYSAQTPVFDLFSFFEGPVRAWGIVQNRRGEVVRRFTTSIDGTVEGDRPTLEAGFH